MLRGVGSGGGFRQVPHGSAIELCRFGKQVPGRFRKISEGLRCMLA